MRLFVNIDHVATVRQARRTDEPDPVRAAVLVELGGAEGITVHLREDRRHIQTRDVELLMDTVRTSINLEIACTEEMLDRAVSWKPAQVTLVPENREEVTTEGGLDVRGRTALIESAVARLVGAGIHTSLFIDPDPDTIRAAVDTATAAIELHTGEYANATTPAEHAHQLGRLQAAADLAVDANLAVHAGHGLTYENVRPVAAITCCQELNIGHSIVSRAVFVGLERAVREMKALIAEARGGAASGGVV